VTAAGAFLALLAGIAIAAPWLFPAGPFHTSTLLLSPPSRALPMGTDDLGRNILVGVAYGARTSLLVALGVSLIAGVLGLVVGGIAGFAGGVVDDVLMRVAEFTWVLPRFFLAIATAAVFGARALPLIVLLGVVSWPGPARILRSAVLGQRHRQYVEATRAMGGGPVRLLVGHILPNSLAPFLVSITLLAGNAILIEAGLSFLGLGDASNPSWGSMLRDAQPVMRGAPWTVLFPAAAVSLAVLAFNLLGDGLVDLLSPLTRRAADGRGPDSIIRSAPAPPVMERRG